MSFFKIVKKSKNSKARTGKIRTSHGLINTPCFMPIATRGAIKNLTAEEVKGLDAEIILGNTFHLYLRPGEKLVKKAGGIQKFMGWNGPLLTDSGGFQVFSLAKMRKISEEGVEFRSPLDGSKHFFSPERSIQIQLDLGSDIVMAFDECTPYPATREYAVESMRLTYEWAKRCKKYFEIQKSKFKSQNYKSKFKNEKNFDMKPLLFGIIQGSVFKDLREESARQIVGLDTDGVAIGGVSVGEPPEKMIEALDWVSPLLPEKKPHYLMGVGYPEQIVEAVKRGIDMFDCVLPTRNGRHGDLFIWNKENANVFKSKNFYSMMHITNKKFESDLRPPDKYCHCYTCRHHSRSYLRHLFATKENLALRLATIHNLAFYLELMRKIRKHI